MELQQLTDEQKAKLKILERQTTRNSVKYSLKNAVFLVSALFLIVFLNQLYVHSNVFTAVSGGFTGLVWMSMIRVDLKTEYDRVSEEVKKILES